MTLAHVPPLLRVAFVAVCLLAFGLRWYRLDYHYLGLDESLSVETALLPLSQLVAFQQAKVFSHPPLHHSLLSLWLPMAGTSELAARYLSLFSGVAAIAAAMAMASALLGRAGALVVGLLMALSPFAVYYGQEARMYTLVSLLALLAGYGLWRYQRGGRRRWLAAAAGAVALGLLTHYYYFFLFAALALAALLMRLHARRDVRPLLAALALGVLPALLWVLLARGTQASIVAVAAAPVRTSWGELTAATVATFVEGAAWVHEPEATPAVAAGALVVLGLFLLARRLRQPGRPWDVAVLLLLWLLVPPLLAEVVPWSIYPRYLMVVFPAALMVVTAALLWLARLWRPLAGGAGLALLYSLGVSLDVHAAPRDVKSGFAEAAAEVTREAAPGDVVALAGPAGSTLLRYYYRGAAPVFPVTADTPVWDPAALAGSLERLTTEYSRVWLIVYAEQDQEAFARAWFTDHAFELRNDYYADTILAAYLSGRVPLQQGLSGPFTFGGVVALDAVLAGAFEENGQRFVAHRTDWRLLQPDQGLAVSSRLVDDAGGTWADYDWWLPLEGPPGTALWQQKGLLLPSDAPEGTYRLMLVVYRREGQEGLPPSPQGPVPGVAEVARLRIGPGS